MLQATVRASEDIRRGLGDQVSDRPARAVGITTTSLEAAREYVLAQDLINQDRNEEAIEHYRLALAKDPDFGKAYRVRQSR